MVPLETTKSSCCLVCLLTLLFCFIQMQLTLPAWSTHPKTATKSAHFYFLVKHGSYIYSRTPLTQILKRDEKESEFQSSICDVNIDSLLILQPFSIQQKGSDRIMHFYDNPGK